MITVAIVGCGYWGPNLIRNVMVSNELKLKTVCDINIDALKKTLLPYPSVKGTVDFKDIVTDSEIDAVIVATPISSHFGLVKACLKHNKHVLVEKPITGSVKEGEEVVELARKNDLRLMCDHTFCYTSAVRKIKALIDNGELGDLLYYDSVRINLGLFQSDVNVIWDLAVHDLSIVDFLFPQEPIMVAAQAFSHVRTGVENIAYVTLTYANSLVAHFHVNWLSPVKIRKTLIGGTKKMIEWNDLVPDQKIKIYDKGISLTESDKKHKDELLISYRSGDILSPRIEPTEALSLVVDEFAASINENREPLTNGEAALRVVRILDAASRSVNANGKSVTL